MKTGWARRLSEKDLVVPARKPEALEHETDGGAILFDSRFRKTIMLNETATLVWRGCDGRKTLDDLANRVQNHYEVNAQTARDHVEQLVALFAEANLLEDA